jgi:hypothetical protein
VLEQLNVFADEDINAAAEALNDVGYTLSPFWHIPLVFFFFFFKKWLINSSFILPKRINENKEKSNNAQTDHLNQLL